MAENATQIICANRHKSCFTCLEKTGYTCPFCRTDTRDDCSEIQGRRYISRTYATLKMIENIADYLTLTQGPLTGQSKINIDRSVRTLKNNITFARHEYFKRLLTSDQMDLLISDDWEYELHQRIQYIWKIEMKIKTDDYPKKLKDLDMQLMTSLIQSTWDFDFDDIEQLHDDLCPYLNNSYESDNDY